MQLINFYISLFLKMLFSSTITISLFVDRTVKVGNGNAHIKIMIQSLMCFAETRMIASTSTIDIKPLKATKVQPWPY